MRTIVLWAIGGLFFVLGATCTDNLAYGFPSSNGLIVLDREGYAVGYSPTNRIPMWVSYRLTRDEALPPIRYARRNDFREDTNLPACCRATLTDYKSSGFDRGHLAPAGDMGWSSNAMSESFLLSNMCPQQPMFNRGVWKDLEYFVREMAADDTNVFVIAGSVFYTNSVARFIGTNRNVRVPDAFYKIVIEEVSDTNSTCYLIPNEGTSLSFTNFVVSLDELKSQVDLSSARIPVRP